MDGTLCLLTAPYPQPFSFFFFPLQLLNMTKPQMRAEIAGNRAALARCGIPQTCVQPPCRAFSLAVVLGFLAGQPAVAKGLGAGCLPRRLPARPHCRPSPAPRSHAVLRCRDVAGHRSPFLETRAAVREVLSEEGFLYDRWALRCARCACSVLRMLLLPRATPAVLPLARCDACSMGSMAGAMARAAAFMLRQRVPAPCRLFHAGLCLLRCSSMVELGGSAAKADSLSLGMGRRVWPFTMDYGLPMNCAP